MDPQIQEDLELFYQKDMEVSAWLVQVLAPAAPVLSICGHSYFGLFFVWAVLYWDPTLPLIAWILPYFLKVVFQRPRPIRQPHHRGWDRWSMPSGHAFAFCAALLEVLLYHQPDWISIIVITLWALAGSLERVRKQVHYLGDVIVAWYFAGILQACRHHFELLQPPKWA